jgi:hypothetical protein
MPPTGGVFWTVISFILTILVFSYLFGDNPFFRFVSAFFIGVTAGYFFVVILYQVIIGRLIAPLANGTVLAIIPVLLSALLLMKLSPRLSPMGSMPMALLVGVGAAVAVGGAILGTLFGQIKGALSFFGGLSSTTQDPGFLIAEGLFLLAGTITSLMYFHFGAREKKPGETKRNPVISIFAAVGKVFIAITLGAVFAGVLTAAISALVERSDFIIRTIQSLVR